MAGRGVMNTHGNTSCLVPIKASFGVIEGKNPSGLPTISGKQRGRK